MSKAAKIWSSACVSLMAISFSSSQVYAQQSNLKCKWIDTTGEFIILDTLLIAPETISFKDHSIDYNYDVNTSTLRITNEIKEDSLFVCYRNFPAEIKQSYQNRTYLEYDSLAPFKHVIKNKPSYLQKEELFSTEGIYKTGSLSRGVSFGNSRSLGVTSSLNFQMEGKLTEELNIRANITDQNVPFQPEGNTQQLREFDNVSIEVYNDKASLKAGDIVLKNSESNFLRYYKNVQGGQASLDYNVGSNGSGKSSVTISAAKGQFADITLEVQEGVQGPYKLRGPNGERFVIVLANSESIYLDGRQLERGFNRDYVIDYNLGEITFNPSVLITRFSRVRATYEYSDQNYSRSIIATNHELQFGKTAFTFNHYQEKDSKNNSLSFDLSDMDKRLISLAGEENLPVPISGEKQVEYSENTIQYLKVDTLDFDGLGHAVFRYSLDSSQQLYRVSFSKVGFGKGDYKLLSNTINGRVFEWISPLSGDSQGNYSAVLFVAAPNKKQMTTFGIEVATSKYGKVYSELAISNHDLNLFSDLDSDDDTGLASKTGYEINAMPVDFLDGYKLSSSINFEYDSKHFNQIDRFRYIEYDRDWSFNPNTETDRFSDNIFNVSSVLEKDLNNKIEYRLSRRKRGGVIDGSQHQFNLNQEMGSLKLKSGGYLLSNKKREDESSWTRFHSELSLNKFFIVPGYKFELDQNELKRSESDSVVSSAMNYQSHQFFIQNDDSLKTKFRLEFTQRKDRQPVNGLMDDFTSTKTTRLNVNTNIGESNHLDLTFTYRNLTFLKTFAENPNEQTVLARLNWSGSFLNKHIRSEMTYATSSSREIRREFVFIPVVTGEGTHAWRDLNSDGVQDITEFFEAINFDERNYIKLFVPTDDFISAFNNQFNLNVSASMPKKWKNYGGLLGVLSKITNRTSVNVNKKNTDDSFGSRFNPFELNTEDNSLIYTKDAIRSTVFYNRSNPGFGLDLGYFSAHSKQLISNGIDSRNQKEFNINSRKKITSELSVLWNATQGQKENQSDFLDDRNYQVNIYSFAPQLVWQPNSTFRISSKAEYKKKEETQKEAGSGHSKISSMVFSARWNKALKNSIDASFKFINIDFYGNENTPLGYELLEALRPGNNFTWNFNYRQKLSNGLQISLSYDGRKSINQRVIHLGRMQVTALF